MPRSKRTETRRKFQEWLATPTRKKKEYFGYTTQKEFAEGENVNEATLSKWKNEPGFMDEIDTERRRELDEDLTDIYDALKKKAKEGDVQAIKFAFKAAGRFIDETTITHRTEEVHDFSQMSDEALSRYIAERLMSSGAIPEEDASTENLAQHIHSILTGGHGQEGLVEPIEVEYLPSTTPALDEGPHGGEAGDHQMEPQPGVPEPPVGQ